MTNTLVGQSYVDKLRSKDHSMVFDMAKSLVK